MTATGHSSHFLIGYNTSWQDHSDNVLLVGSLNYDSPSPNHPPTHLPLFLSLCVSLSFTCRAIPCWLNHDDRARVTHAAYLLSCSRMNWFNPPVLSLHSFFIVRLICFISQQSTASLSSWADGSQQEKTMTPSQYLGKAFLVNGPASRPSFHGKA